MADYRRLEVLARDPPGLPDLSDDGGEWEDGDAAFVRAAGEVLLRGLAWCGGVYGVLWLLGRAWG